jgi:hypothetical protein
MMAHRWRRLAAVAAIAAVTIGCGGGESTVRPFVKRGGPAEKATEKPSDEAETKDGSKDPKKAASKENGQGEAKANGAKDQGA